MVAHDLRAPLTSILGWIEIIEQDGIEDDSVSQALGVIKRNAVAEKQLVSGLLDFSGMAADGSGLKLQSDDLMRLLDPTRERFEPMAAQKKIKLEFETSEALPPIEADSHRLFRVFDNLLSNARISRRAEGKSKFALVP